MVRKRALCALAMTLAWASGAWAGDVKLGAVTLSVSPPKGYCAVNGLTGPERAFLQNMRDVLKGMTIELVQASVPCGDLQAFNMGTLRSFERWVQVQTFRRGDGFRTLNVPRSTFITEVTRSAERAPPDLGKLSEKYRESLASGGMTLLDKPTMVPAGSDDRAAFFTSQMAVNYEGQGNSIVNAFMAMTTVKSLLVTVIAYEKTTAKGEADAPPLVASDALDKLLRSN